MATGSAAYTAITHHLGELATLEQELSLSARLVTISDDLCHLAGGCTDGPAPTSPTRRAVRV